MRLDKYFYILLFCVVFISCNQSKDKLNGVNDRQVLIEYLKGSFKISPEPEKFDSLYLAKLKQKDRSLEIDSLISKDLSIKRYKELNLDFAEYYPHNYYRDRNSGEDVAIYFIRNFKTGKIYLDYYNWDAGNITEDYCAYSSIDLSQSEGVSKQDIKVYTGIKSNRKFANWELYPIVEKGGIEAFLNDEFRFKKITKVELENLFAFYDNVVHDFWDRDSLVSNPIQLVQFLGCQANEIPKRYHNTADLVYLKEQINLLIARNSKCDSINNFQWIYKANHRLRERFVSLHGSRKTFYSYSVEERSYCF